ncbi:ATP-citrate synthase alpha chain protein 1 [Platanthera guangdongensis]|uniref:ATP-citrate synthase alpha chain protein 1 n=1 Tax=Platanthera guangdongensis TaxID=2320717 RepID=A0ABR2MK94_9ASPA
MARKKIREYDSKRLLKQHLNKLVGIQIDIRSAQITESTDFNGLVESEPWLATEELVVKPDMLFGKRGKSGLVGLNLNLAQVASFIKDRLGEEVEIGGCRGPVTAFIVEPFVPHSHEFYLSVISDRLGCSISFSDCGGIEIEDNWDKDLQNHSPNRATSMNQLPSNSGGGSATRRLLGQPAGSKNIVI